MTSDDFKIGDRIEYKIIDDYWLPGIIVNITKKRVVIKLDRYPESSRNTRHDQLRKE